MSQKTKTKTPVSELRKDLVSNTWVVVADKRSGRPRSFKKKAEKKITGEELKKEKERCPFCHLDKKENLLTYKKKNGAWSLRVIPNDFPAFIHKTSLNIHDEGPFRVMNGVGFCEVIITRSHTKQVSQMTVPEITEIIDAFQVRYLALMNQRHIKYISIFQNYGKEAGASIKHPHFQLIATPMVDPDIYRSLHGSRKYFESNHECVHCVMLEWEMKSKKRIVFENDEFVVLCPFASRIAFETRIYPKRHLAYFERTGTKLKIQLAEAVGFALARIKKQLGDPAYNFFLHTAPCDGRTYDHYHWHFEILPKISIWAGFELGTGTEICSVKPEKAAEILRKK